MCGSVGVIVHLKVRPGVCTQGKLFGSASFLLLVLCGHKEPLLISSSWDLMKLDAH